MNRLRDRQWVVRPCSAAARRSATGECGAGRREIPELEGELAKYLDDLHATATFRPVNGSVDVLSVGVGSVV